MMRSMRQMSKYIFYVLAIAFIGWLVFDVGMGITGRSTGATGDVVLKVNGQEVHYAQWQQVYQSRPTERKRACSYQFFQHSPLLAPRIFSAGDRYRARPIGFRPSTLAFL